MGVWNTGRANARLFDGFMREFRLWSVARTAEQIKSNYQAFLTGEEPGLLSVFPLAGEQTAW